MLAALNSIEPEVRDLVHLDVFHGGEAWTIERRPQVVAMLEKKLAALTTALGQMAYLEGRFTAGDLMMTVFRELVDSGVLARFPALHAHRRRCKARPVFTKALADQMGAFAANTTATVALLE